MYYFTDKKKGTLTLHETKLIVFLFTAGALILKPPLF